MTLGLSDEEASELHHKYYTTYGLALRGLTRHYGVGDVLHALSPLAYSNCMSLDPLDFDRKCDGSLPLENMIKPHPGLRKLFQDIDRSKARVWALTNAYKPVNIVSIDEGSNSPALSQHAERVLRILDLEDQIDGLVYCNYNEPDFVCKPEPEYYRKVCPILAHTCSF